MDSNKSKPCFKLQKVKGSGTFGYVIEAIDLNSGLTVAVKRVRKAELNVSREYTILQKLSTCDQIVKLFEMFYSRDKKKKIIQNFVFEYLPSSLERYIQHFAIDKPKKFIPIGKAKSILYNVLEGLAMAHSKNICNRDLKPDNILLDNNKNAKICDFGSSKILKNNINIPYITTRFYRAPELIFCLQNYSTSIDIWSVGCIFAEMLLKKPLFPAENDGALFIEIASLIGFPDKKERAYLFKMLTPEMIHLVDSFNYLKEVSLYNIIPSYYEGQAKAQAADLLSKMIRWTPLKRSNASELLKHDFFKK